MTPKMTQKPCTRCGQPVDTQTDSFTLNDGEATHTTCPISPELAALPPAPPESIPSITGAAEDRLSPVFLTVAEAALLLRLSHQSIRRYIRQGQLPAKRVRGGQIVLIDKTDLLALLEDVKEVKDADY